MELYKKDISKKGIARELGINKNTVKKVIK